MKKTSNNCNASKTAADLNLPKYETTSPYWIFEQTVN